jgi:hypothetical protein
MAGKEVITANEISANTRIDCSSLSNGAYLVNLTNEKRTYNFKVMVLHLE